MMKSSGVQKKLIVAVLLLTFVIVIPSVKALPLYQIPCFGSEGCPEPVNPEDGEYYSIQCTTNSIWVWRSMPTLMLVTGISMLQVDDLSDGGSLVAPLDVTVTRNGDTITLSGTNGNLAPQPGEKSFSWNECIERNGGLPELPPIGQELTDEQIACMNLPTEQEEVECLNALESDSDTANAQTCEDPIYLNAHLEECTFVSCPLDQSIRVADLSECPTAEDIFIERVIEAIRLCLSFSVAIVSGSIAILGRRRKRK